MKKIYSRPVMEIHKVATENILNGFSEDTNNTPEAPNGTEAGAKEVNLDFWEDDEEDDEEV